MGRPYSLDLRVRVIDAIEGGASMRAAARQFAVSASSAIKWMERFSRTGSVAPDRPSKTKQSRLNDNKAWLLALVAAEPDLTLEEIKERLADRKVEVCVSALWRFFERNDISFKKNRARGRAGPAGRRDGTRAMAKRASLA